MLAGKVIGRVWSAKKLDSLPAGALLEVELDRKAGTIVAQDPLGCGEGERVLVTTGSVVQNHFPGSDALVDALVVAALEETSSSPAARTKKP